MSNDAETNQNTLRNFGFCVSPRGARTPRITRENRSESAGGNDPRISHEGLRAELESVAQKYRDQSISKFEACTELVSRLGSHRDIEETAKESTLGMYLAELDSIESVLKQAAS